MTNQMWVLTDMKYPPCRSMESGMRTIFGLKGFGWNFQESYRCTKTHLKKIARL